MTKRETLAVPSINLHKNRPSYQRIPMTLTGIDDVQRAPRIARFRTPEVVKRDLGDRQRGLDSRGRTYTFRYHTWPLPSSCSDRIPCGARLAGSSSIVTVIT